MSTSTQLRTWLTTALLLIAVSGAWGEETPFYTLSAVQSSGNTAYANNYDVTINNMQWSVPGNQNFSGYWRIGGKSLDKVERMITAKTAMGSAINKVVITHNGVSNSNLNVHSVALLVSSRSDFSDEIGKKYINRPSVSSEGILEFVADEAWPENAYYKIIINVSNSTGTNYGLNFVKAEFFSPGSSTPPTTTKYTVNLEDSYEGGTVTASPTTAAEGAPITLTATPDAGYQFTSWTVLDSDLNEVEVSNDQFTMPASDVNVYAIFGVIPTYEAKFYVNGAQEGETQTLKEGETITFPADPANISGKTFMGWTTTPIDGSTDAEPTMVSSGTMGTDNISFYAVFANASGGGSATYNLVETAPTNWTGDYLIVYNNTYAMNTHSGNQNANTFATYTDISKYYTESTKSFASNSTTDALIYRAAKTTKGYSLYCVTDGSYLSISNGSTSTGAKLRWDTSYTEDACDWTLGVGSLGNVGSNTLYVRWNNNSGSYRFAAYASNGQQAIQLFKKQGGLSYSAYCTTVGAAQIPNLIKTETATLNVGDEVDLSTYLNLPSDYEGTVTYSSEQEGTLVTLVGKMMSANAAGTATITVTAPAQGNYLETTGTITFTISKKTPGISFAKSELRVLIDTDAASIVEPTLNNPNRLNVTYSLRHTKDSSIDKIATIDSATGEITLADKGLSTEVEDNGHVYVQATTEATDTYAAGLAEYELVVYRNVPTFTYSPTTVTIDHDEIDAEHLPTPSVQDNRNVVELTSSNPEVATIDADKKAIVFVGYGTTTITGKTYATRDYASATASYELTFAPRYTVHFVINDFPMDHDMTRPLREETTGAGISVPAADLSFLGWTFLGWSKNEVKPQSTTRPALETITDGKYYPSDNSTLYAVYQRTEGGEETPNGKYLIYADVNGTKYYMTGKPVASNTTVDQMLSTTDRTKATQFTITTNPDNEAQKSLAFDDNGTTKYLCVTTSSNYVQSQEAAYYFTTSNGEKTGTTRFGHSSSRSLAFRTTSTNPIHDYYVFKSYSNTNITEESTEYYDLMIEPATGGSTTYYTTSITNQKVTVAASSGLAHYATFSCDQPVVVPHELSQEGFNVQVYTVHVKNGKIQKETISASTTEGGHGIRYDVNELIHYTYIPANIGVLLAITPTYSPTILEEYNPANKYQVPYYLVKENAELDTKFADDAAANNWLYPDTKDKSELPNHKFYKLAYYDQKADNYMEKYLGFYYGAANGGAFTTKPGLAYLAVPYDVALEVTGFAFDATTEEEDIETAIDCIDSQADNSDSRIYNLQGQRVSRPQHGIYIIGGKKVLVK